MRERIIKINEFDYYVKDNDTYKKMEELAIGICESIRESWGDQIFDVDYEIIGQTGEYDLRFLIILQKLTKMGDEMSSNLSNQFKIYSVDTKAFYNEKERELKWAKILLEELLRNQK